MPYGIIYSLPKPRGYVPVTIAMIVILGRKRWGARGGAIIEIATR